MNAKMKNISRSEVLTLKEQISYQDGQVVSKTLAQNSAVSITLFSFAKGEEISSHKSDGDAFVTCLDGIGKSPLTERNICFTRGNPSSCRPGTLMRCMDKRPSRCFWSLYFKQSGLCILSP